MLVIYLNSTIFYLLKCYFKMLQAQLVFTKCMIVPNKDPVLFSTRTGYITLSKPPLASLRISFFPFKMGRFCGIIRIK